MLYHNNNTADEVDIFDLCIHEVFDEQTQHSASSSSLISENSDTSLFFDIAEAMTPTAATAMVEPEQQDSQSSLPSHMFWDIVEANAPVVMSLDKENEQEEEQSPTLEQQTSHVSACTLFFQQQQPQKSLSRKSLVAHKKSSPLKKKTKKTLLKPSLSTQRITLTNLALNQGFVNVHWSHGG
eukprot:CAMPEP_0172440702 /NCGR_PEP_ID=MMETSP1065-20121228/1325_1 /TAXON_ID=265537 /ORGANISM="Amphiprora paludosa, Strain CCMP125" /LENGTH=181 /DNA_ID=CAMNT_0013189679 /DNA_START=37 /DNA_END=578 /DNA_ORIENTATION=+